MLRNLLFCGVLLALIMNEPCSAQFLQIPIAGQEGRDWTIVNYVDWKDTGFMDAYCGSKAYDGHEGTDFTLRSFKQMDSGVNVLAAASGRVTFIKDGEFDRETVSDPPKGLGNYIAIRHGNGYYSYYGHLKKGSISVNLNDSVVAGQVIAQVGSSGNSTDPHLHFELYFDSLYVVDPFAGTCGNPTSLWLNEPMYDTSINVWDFGMHNTNVQIDSLRERFETVKCCPYQFPPSSSNPITFWAHLHGIKKGETLDINWYTPSKSLWFNYSITMSQDWWYYYYWSFIDNKDLSLGTWTCELVHQGKTIAKQDFEVTDAANIETLTNSSFCNTIKNSTDAELSSRMRSGNLEIRDLRGISMNYSAFEELPKGCYVLMYTNMKNGNVCYSKRIKHH